MPLDQVAPTVDVAATRMERLLGSQDDGNGESKAPHLAPPAGQEGAETEVTWAQALVKGVGREGFEPPTPCASCRCSSQLS